MWKVDVYWKPLPPCFVAMNEKESRLSMMIMIDDNDDDHDHDDKDDEDDEDDR